MLILMKKIAEIMMGGEGFRSQVSGSVHIYAPLPYSLSGSVRIKNREPKSFQTHGLL